MIQLVKKTAIQAFGMNMSINVHIQNFLKHVLKEAGAGIVLIPLKNKWDIINVTLIRQNTE